MKMIEYLSKFDHWLCWKYLPAKEGKKPRKLPINVRTGEACNLTDVSNGSSLSDVKAYMSKKAGTPWAVDGVEFILTPSVNLVMGDIDDCVDADGKLSDSAKKLLDELDTCCVYSPSGKGVRFIAFGSIPSNFRNYQISEEIFGCKVELFCVSGAPTITTKVIPGYSDFINVRSSQLLDMYEQCIRKEKEKEDEKRRHSVVSGPFIPKMNYDDIPSVDEMAKILSFIPPNIDYWTWMLITVGIGRSYPTSQAVNLIFNWCGQEFNEKNPEETIHKIIKSANIRPDGCTWMVARKYAKQYGYTPPKPLPKEFGFAEELRIAYTKGYHQALSDTSLGLVDEKLLAMWSRLSINQSSVELLNLGWSDEKNAMSIPYFVDNTDMVVATEYYGEEGSWIDGGAKPVYMTDTTSDGRHLIMPSAVRAIKMFQTSLDKPDRGISFVGLPPEIDGTTLFTIGKLNKPVFVCDMYADRSLIDKIRPSGCKILPLQTSAEIVFDNADDRTLGFLLNQAR